MKQKKENRVALLLHWAGEQKIWLFLAIFLSAVSGLCIIVPYIGIYRLMDATFNHTCKRRNLWCTYRGNDCSGGNFAVCPVWLFRRSSP